MVDMVAMEDMVEAMAEATVDTIITEAITVDTGAMEEATTIMVKFLFSYCSIMFVVHR